MKKQKNKNRENELSERTNSLWLRWCSYCIYQYGLLGHANGLNPDPLGRCEQNQVVLSQPVRHRLERRERDLWRVFWPLAVSRNDEIEWLYYRKTKAERIKDRYIIPKRVSVLLGFKSNFSLMECPAQCWFSFQLYFVSAISMRPVIVIQHTDVHRKISIMYSSSSVHLYLEEHSRPFPL